MSSSAKTIKTPNFDRINPQTCINGKLRRLHRLINSAYQSKINQFGLRGSMLTILFIIGKKRGINQKTLADLLVLDQSTMSRDLKKLVRDGLVVISKGQDPRHSDLQLSTQGYQLLEEIVPVWEQFHYTVEALVGEELIQQLDKLTARIQANLEEIKA